MKKLITSVLAVLLLTNFNYAQNCSNPVSAVVFQNNFNQIAVQQNNQLKLNKSIQFANENCMMAAQVKNIAQLFNDDNYRLEFCKVAYLHTFDRVNFFDVYDAFGTFSAALRLYDFIRLIESAPVVVTPSPVTTTVTNTAPKEPVFPNFAYPSTVNYNGNKGCHGVLTSDATFKAIAQNVFDQPTDESKFVAIQMAYEQNCMSFAQIMKLTFLLQSESLRLKILVNSFSKIYDQDNYQSGIVLFSNTAMQNEWTTYAKTYLAPPPPPVVVCTTSDVEFKKLNEELKAKRFPDDKRGLISIWVKDRCLNVAQIKELSKQFAFGDDKMKVFKGFYEKCNDKNNYYILVDELAFSSEKEDLRNFILKEGK